MLFALERKNILPGTAHLDQDDKIRKVIRKLELQKAVWLRKDSYHSPGITMSDISTAEEQYMLSFYVPPSSLEACKEAIFRAGAGNHPGGLYTRVCFVTKGTGQFLPNEGASPNIGCVGKLEMLVEMKVESICVGKDVMLQAVEELKRAHPYKVVRCSLRPLLESVFI